MGTLIPGYTIIVPVRNGSSKISALIEELKAFADSSKSLKSSDTSDFPTDLVLVDDGSTDMSWETIRRYAEGRRTGAMKIRGIRLDRRRGQQSALLAGMTDCRNRPVITMDDDLAHPVSALPLMAALLEEGKDLVYASPPARPGTIFRRILSRIHQLNLCLITGTSLKVRVGSYRALSPALVDRILSAPISFPYISAQALTLRPRPRTGMITTEYWRNSSEGRFTFRSLLNLEIRLAAAYGPFRIFRSFSRNHQVVTGDSAEQWIAERCGT